LANDEESDTADHFNSDDGLLSGNESLVSSTRSYSRVPNEVNSQLSPQKTIALFEKWNQYLTEAIPLANPVTDPETIYHNVVGVLRDMKLAKPATYRNDVWVEALKVWSLPKLLLLSKVWILKANRAAQYDLRFS